MGYPEINLSYLRTLTDSTGIIQHAAHSVPNRRLGYTTDDNSRALIVAAQHYEQTREREDLDLAVEYLSFLHYARSADNRFKNFMTYQRVFLDDEGTEDSFGRALWSCGYVSASALPENIRVVAKKLFENCLVWVGDLESPRARAYSILAMYEFLRVHEDRAGLKSKIDALADSLLAGLKAYSTANWVWYEPYLTYGNAIIALGMLVAGEVTGREKYRQAAKKTIGFLTDTLIVNGRLEIVGNDGWYMRDGKRAWYDQQSIDAGYTVYLYVSAYKLLRDKRFLDLARIAHSWFFGNNRSGLWVYDPETHGCCDAICAWGLNLNQGAESCVSFLLAQLAMKDFGDADSS